MRIKQSWMAGVMALAIGLVSGAAAQPNTNTVTLKVGDPAPKLQTGKWVQGEPVSAFAAGKAYIVEFWATWCGPCRATIPHLNDIHNKYKDKGLIVIGQNCWEEDDALVEPFIKEMGDKMTYRVALDNKTDSKTGTMADTWMRAAGRSGIPSAFLVDTQGRIAWIGHPMNLKESDLDLVLAGKYDLTKAAADYQEEQAKEGLAKTLTQQLIAREWDAAAVTLAKLEANTPEAGKADLAWPQFQVLMGQKKMDAAVALVDKTAQAERPPAIILNMMAWKLATTEGLKEEPLKVAERAAEKANSLLQGKHPVVLNTLARVNFLLGNKDKALQLAEQAHSLAKGKLKETLKAALASYKEGKLPDLK